jgi:GT2 family glycosyltransferase
MANVTVIIATYNRSALLEKALASLEAQRTPPGLTWQAVIVDNNSNDDTRRVVESFDSMRTGRFRYVFEGRQGKSFALNTGMAHATSEILAFTDDDVTLAPCWLGNLVHGLESSTCGGAGGKIVPSWTSPIPRWLDTDAIAGAIVNIDLGSVRCLFTRRMPAGANMAFRRDVLDRIGPFRTDIGPTTGSEIRGEDSELCRRVAAAGEQIVYVPDAIVFHPVEPHRTEPRYLQRWYFDSGRAQVRTGGIVPGSNRYFGIPRYFWRMGAEAFGSWICAVDARRRFTSKLRFYEVLGQIVEARRLGCASADAIRPKSHQGTYAVAGPAMRRRSPARTS